MNIPPLHTTTAVQTSFNNPVYGQKGEYSLSAHVRVPYFTALMDLKRVTKELKTHEEVTPSLDNTYNLVELFQRNIDPERVKREIVDGFLKNPTKLKFFNSLTFVLLPKDSHGHIQSDFEDVVGSDPSIPYDGQDEFDKFFQNGEKSVFGGVQFVSTDAASLSRLRWDANSVDAVAVDGQHRLKALKLWMEGNNNELAEIARATRVPVIFLLLHKSVGFVAAAGTNAGIKTIAREIFTDLNKNAKEVDLATQIILDDRSLASCCVRSLITEGTCADHDTKLPLSLLRWQDANNRFDQRYFLNALVNLHVIVEDLLDLSPPVKEGTMEKNKVLTFISSTKEVVGMPDSQTGQLKLLSNDRQDLEDFYRQRFLDDEGEPKAPLSGIPPQFLKSAVDGFTARYANWLLRILREFKPYADLVQYARENQLVEGQFAQYFAQPKDHRSQLDNELQAQHGENWYDLIIDQHERHIEKNIKKINAPDDLGEEWAFKTIFQKAILRFAKQLFVKSPDDQRNKLGSVDDYIAFLNKLYEFGILRVLAPLTNENYLLWTFLSVNYGSNKIKVASTSERRIQAFLALLYYSVRLAKHEGNVLVAEEDGDGSTISPEQLEKKWRTKQAGTEWPASFDYYEALLKEFAKSADVIAGIADASAMSDEKRRTIARSRITAILRFGLRPFFKETQSVTVLCDQDQI
jgi:hypothetical protein